MLFLQQNIRENISFFHEKKIKTGKSEKGQEAGCCRNWVVIFHLYVIK